MKLNGLEFALMNNRVRAWSQRVLETPIMIGPRAARRGLRVLELGCGRRGSILHSSLPKTQRGI